MKKILIFSILLTGCGSMQRSCTSMTGSFTYKCSESGVEYVQSDSGLAIHVDQNGRPKVCN